MPFPGIQKAFEPFGIVQIPSSHYFSFCTFQQFTAAHNNFSFSFSLHVALFFHFNPPLHALHGINLHALLLVFHVNLTRPVADE